MNEKDIEYETNNIAYYFQSTDDGGGIKCKNYELCETVLPKWWFECKAITYALIVICCLEHGVIILVKEY